MSSSPSHARRDRVPEERRSHAVLIFGLVSIALVAAVGTSVDLSRLEAARSELQQRLDAALAAGAREDKGERAGTAEDVFDSAPTGSTARPAARRFEEEAAGLTGTVSAAVPTTISSMLGIRSIRVTAIGRAGPIAARCADPVVRAKDRAGCAITIRTSTQTRPQS